MLQDYCIGTEISLRLPQCQSQWRNLSWLIATNRSTKQRFYFMGHILHQYSRFPDSKDPLMMSIRCRFDTKVSDRYLIDVNMRTYANQFVIVLRSQHLLEQTMRHVDINLKDCYRNARNELEDNLHVQKHLNRSRIAYSYTNFANENKPLISTRNYPVQWHTHRPWSYMIIFP